MPKLFCAPQFGGTRLGFVLALAGIATLLLSGSRLLQAIKNRHPVIIGCDKAIGVAFANRWIQITNCQLDLPMAIVSSPASNQRPAELLVPLRPLENSAAQVHAVLQTSHPIFIAAFLQMQRLKSPDEAAAWVSRNHEMAFPKRSVSGLARIARISERPEWASLRSSVTEEFILVKESERPRFGWNPWFFGAGIGAFVFGVFAALNGRRAAR